MNRLIIINWKWLPITPLDADEEWDNYANYSSIISVEGTQNQLLQLNVQREEAEFDDEYEEYYDPRNQLLKKLLTDYSKEYEILLFLHKNAPHYYGEYDLTWFQEHIPELKVVLFGGGEDYLYDLHNASSGLLDQVGNFSPKALGDQTLLKSSYFDGIWNHYTGNAALTDEHYSIIRKVLEEHLPIFEMDQPSSDAVKWAIHILQEMTDLPANLVEELQQLANGQLPNIMKVRNLLNG